MPRGSSRWAHTVAWALMLFALVPAARAQGPSASASLPPDAPSDLRSGHVWLFDRFGRGEDGLLVHIPPRDQRVGGVVARGARTLAERPEALVAVRDRVYLIAPPRREPAPPAPGGPEVQAPRVPVMTYASRHVSRLTARRIGPGAWDYLPEGRTESQPSLVGAGAVLGVAALGTGPLVLMQGEADGWLSLQWLDDRTWHALNPPPALMSGPAPQWCALVAAGAEREVLLLVAPHPGEVQVWTGVLERSALSAGGPNPGPRLDWSPVPRLVMNLTPAGGPDVTDLERAGFAMDGGVLTAWVVHGDEATVYRLNGDRVTPVGRIQGVPAGAIIVPVLGLSRLAVLSHAAESATPAGAPGATSREALLPRQRDPSYDVREVSTIDGADLFSGRTRKAGLLSARDVWMVGMALALLMIVVLLFVLRRESAGGGAAVVVLPEGAALARPLRRLIAASLDNLLALYLGSWLSGVPLGVITGSQVFIDPAQIVELLGCASAAGLAFSVAGEWFMGRTPGKLLVGVGVIGLSRAQAGAPAGTPADPGKVVGSTRIGWPSLRQALTRNLVKWGMPPLTVFLLFDSAFRHPGDLLSRTLVIEPLPPSDEARPD